MSFIEVMVTLLIASYVFTRVLTNALDLLKKVKYLELQDRFHAEVSRTASVIRAINETSEDWGALDVGGTVPIKLLYNGTSLVTAPTNCNFIDNYITPECVTDSKAIFTTIIEKNLIAGSSIPSNEGLEFKIITACVKNRVCDTKKVKPIIANLVLFNTKVGNTTINASVTPTGATTPTGIPTPTNTTVRPTRTPIYIGISRPPIYVYLEDWISNNSDD